MEGFKTFSSQSELGLKPDGDRCSIFSKALSLGFQGIEFGIDRDYREDPLWTGDGNLRDRMRATAEKTGVEAASICLHLLNHDEYSPASENTAYRNVGMKLVRNTVEACAQIGGSVILVPFFGTASLTSEGHIQRLIEGMKSLSPLAEENKVCLGLETSLEAPEVIRIVEAIDSEYVQVYFDIGNAVSRGYNVVEEIEELGETIAQVHVKDSPSRNMLGEGNVDFTAAIDALRKVGFKGYLMLETPSTDDSGVAAATNLAYLKRFVEGR
jgi:hexulose-6-phosphate isomerase